MPSIDPTTSLSDLAVTVAGASRVFQRHRLDFCCAGSRSLAEASADSGLDAAALAAEIEHEDAGPTDDWKGLDAAALADRIEATYHASHRRELPALIELARKVEAVHADKPACPRGLAAHLVAFTAEFEQHMQKEETVLFPLIRQGQGAWCAGPVQVMEREHEDAAAALRRTRALTGDLVAPDGACTTWRALYARLEVFERELMEHAGIENSVLFPKALAGDR